MCTNSPRFAVAVIDAEQDIQKRYKLACAWGTGRGRAMKQALAAPSDVYLRRFLFFFSDFSMQILSAMGTSI